MLLSIADLEARRLCQDSAESAQSTHRVAPGEARVGQGENEDQPSANIRAPDSQRLRPPPRNPPLDARGVERWYPW